MIAYKTFGEYLKEQLLRRKQGNPSYSLRAFAGKLKLSPGHLSGIINGRRAISEERAADIALYLDASPEEISYLQNLVRARSTKQTRMHDQAVSVLKENSRTVQTEVLSRDQFRFLAEWYHMAILELLRIRPGASTLDLGEELGIDRTLAKAACDRLYRLCLISEKRTVIIDKTFRVSDGDFSRALRCFHTQMIEIAATQAKEGDASKRFLGNILFSCHSDLLPEINKLISDFRSELLEFIKDANRNIPDQDKILYSLATQLFPVNTGTKN